MILPIGHQDSSVRRLPWVTFSIMASCLLAFLLTDTSALETAPEPAERLEEAADYWRRHAYLEVDPRIREHVAYDVMPNQRSQYLATLPDLAAPLRPEYAEGLALEQLELDRIQAVSVAIVADQGPKPVLLIDLLANWNEPEAEALRGVRLRSDRFDPRRLLGIEAEAQQSFVTLVARLLEATRGVPLPGVEAALGRPFARYATLAEYEREVLGVAE